MPRETKTTSKKALAGADAGKGVRGRNVSNRPWKDVTEKRASARVKDLNARKMTFEQRREKAQRLKEVKLKEQLIKAAEADEKREMRLRREENARIREERAKKNEVVQIISNPNKIKKLSKKQMRNIRLVNDSSMLAK